MGHWSKDNFSDWWACYTEKLEGQTQNGSSRVASWPLPSDFLGCLMGIGGHEVCSLANCGWEWGQNSQGANESAEESEGIIHACVRLRTCFGT